MEDGGIAVDNRRIKKIIITTIYEEEDGGEFKYELEVGADASKDEYITFVQEKSIQPIYEVGKDEPIKYVDLGNVRLLVSKRYPARDL